MKLFRFKNFVRTCAFAIALLLSISSAKAQVNIETLSNWTKGWSYCQAAQADKNAALPDWLAAGFDKAKNMCYGDGNLYVVNHSAPAIYVIDARTGKKLRELDRLYRQTHRDQISKRNKAYRQKNLEKLREYSKRYYQRNRTKICKRKKDHRRKE